MAGDMMAGDAPGNPRWRQEWSYLWSFGSGWSRGASGERQPRALHVALGGGGRVGWATSAPHSGSSHPLHHRGDHLQIQPRSLSLLVLGDRGALEALGVRWAQEGQLNPFLPGLLLVPFLPCCPAKGTRKTRGQTRWQRSLPGACKQEAAHPFPYSQTVPWGRTWMFPCLQGRGALQKGALPSSRIFGPGCLWTAPAPHAMCTVATRGSSKIINVNFFCTCRWLRCCSRAQRRRRMLVCILALCCGSPRRRISLYAHCCPIYPLSAGSIKKP